VLGDQQGLKPRDAPSREPDVGSPWPLCLRIVNDRAPEFAVAGSWHQVELLGLADRCPTVVHTELGVDPVGVSPYGAQGDDELASDVRAVQVGSEQPEHVQFAVAQWLYQTRLDGCRIPGLVDGC
jgi:hypothetical protein